MLTPIHSPQKLRQYSAYDLEWYPRSYELRCVGVYDEQGYRHYLTIRDFLNAECTSKTSGRWYYAHAGGLADTQFILCYIMNHDEWSAEIIFSGSSAIIITLRKGKHYWRFIDSLWLFRVPLKDIGKMIGLPKLECDFDAPLNELILYNERDCQVLYEAIYAFENRILELGGQLQYTIASTAMQLFRRQFLNDDISTSRYCNDIARQAYYASRIEAFSRERLSGDLYYYDINSSFPACMCRPLPGSLIKYGHTFRDSDLCLVKVTVKVQEQNIPPLPIRWGGRIFFPVGQWTGWYCGEDLNRLSLSRGSILKIHEVLTFESTTYLKDYAQTIYELRRQSSDDAERYILKILLNSLYGKFAERSNKTLTWFKPEKTDSKRFIQAGIYESDINRPLIHCHVPISMYITAYSRSLLLDYMNLCDSVYYCDTDGFCTSQSDLPISDGLGKLKLEKHESHAHFYGPKFYAFGDTVRAKGFSHLTLDEFNRLVRGESHDMTRMARIRESMRGGRIYPHDIHMDKHVKNRIHKRKFLKNGGSRPWTYDEIISLRIPYLL